MAKFDVSVLEYGTYKRVQYGQYRKELHYIVEAASADEAAVAETPDEPSSVGDVHFYDEDGNEIEVHEDVNNPIEFSCDGADFMEAEEVANG